ncbi:uncharacterized protein LOC126765672 [Bactrocera neohumeralis]|uniref:uncharacterized protein LOC120778485 n=1 Tax=Bactrocera tryoni TaxID=59916 RepID=UPI001A965B91|nr:uncharacterized protein LOC120778485 [Bactrocera tryoni]XP_050339313.1 uncharacterized protein LOC126765672 [Bactrocera neohumeralis]
MDCRVTCILLFLISCLILPVLSKSAETTDTSKEMEKASSSMEEDNVGEAEKNNSDEDFLKSKERLNAEFLTFSAPEEDESEDEEKIENLLELLSPRRIFLIEAPANTTIIGIDNKAEERDAIADVFSGGNTDADNNSETKNQ